MSTRLVVLSDTHMPARGRFLPPDLIEELKRADAIIHLGDFVHESVADDLAGLGELYAVHGNNDPPSLQERFPPLEFLSIEGRRFALLHGDIGGRTALDAARQVTGVDVVLFGHSHQPRLMRENGRLLFNPGSPTDKRWSRHRAYGIIDVGETVDARIVTL